MVSVVTNVVTWRGTDERKTANSLRISGLMWCHQESNRGHKDFQSFALPTELWHQRLTLSGAFCVAKVRVFCCSAKFFCAFLWIIFKYLC